MKTSIRARAVGGRGTLGLVAAGLIAGAVAGLAADASAQQSQAAYRSVKAGWAKLRADGGSGNPMVEIPAGIASAIEDAAASMFGRTPEPAGPAATPAPAATPKP